MSLDLLDAQTALLLATVDSLGESDLAQPSVLPGWSRGHVLGHIAGNAEGLGRRARFVIDGVPRSMYESVEARDADIAWRSQRSLALHRLALAATHDDLMRDFAGLPSSRLDDDIELREGLLIRVGDLPLMRLQEVSIHHADLGTDGYTWMDWPDELAAWALPRAVRMFAARDAFPVAWVEADGNRLVVSEADGPGLRGSSVEVLAWITGRAPGSGLTPVGIAAVPDAPAWI